MRFKYNESGNDNYVINVKRIDNDDDGNDVITIIILIIIMTVTMFLVIYHKL